MSKYVVALYMRLSVEDSRVESMNIETQRKILRNYAQALNEEKIEILEFVDNGYSGTNFERPAVQKLISMVQKFKVNCIIVKDFSRFGRNSIEVGYFTQKVFPLFNVRFISMSDCFDSNDHVGETGGIDVMFKYLINEHYSRDLSVKSKSAKLAKMRSGEYKNGVYCYGYKRGEQGEQVVNEETAEVVRLIFRLSSEGKTSSQIIKELFERKIATPAQYKAKQGKAYDVSLCKYWDKAQICRMLQNEQYIGTFVMCKMSVAEVGSSHFKKNDESEWIKVPNHHQAIISKELFEKVQEQFKGNSQGERKIHKYPLKSKVICGCCKHTMQRMTTKKPVYACKYTRYDETEPCYNLTVFEEDLHNIILEIIQKQAQLTMKTDAADNWDNLNLKSTKVIELEKQIQNCNDEKQQLYEQFVMEEITLEVFTSEKAKLNKKADELKRQYKLVAEQVEQMKMDSSKKNEIVQMAKDVSEDIAKENSLTQELADLLIDKIYVYPDKRIEIQWKAGSFFSEKFENWENNFLVLA